MKSPGGSSKTGFFGRFFSSFRKGGKAKSLIGMSIGTSSIKLVELKKTGADDWQLVHFATAQLPEETIVNREIVNPLAVVENIKTLDNELGLQERNVAISISGTSVIIKRLTVEVEKKTELEGQVFWEAEQYLPFDINEVYMDYSVLSPQSTGSVDVILVAAKQDVLDSYMGCVQDAGFVPKIVDVDFFALQHVFEANYQTPASQSSCLVDIGAASLKLLIVHDGIPVFTKESLMGGNNLTNEIQKHLDLSFADAESLKVSAQGVGTPQEVQELVGIMNENVAAEVKRGIDFYNASSSGAPVGGIYLTGGSAKLPNLVNFVANATGIQCQILNPFNVVSYDPEKLTDAEAVEIAPMAALALGLSIRAGAE